MSEYAVEAEGISRRHGSLVAVQPLDLLVPQGIRLGVVGPNGAGKTTLMQMIAGVLAPTARRLTVLGHDTLRNPRGAKAGIGVVPQGTTLDTELTVRENLAVFASYLGLTQSQAKYRDADMRFMVQTTAAAYCPEYIR